MNILKAGIERDQGGGCVTWIRVGDLDGRGRVGLAPTIRNDPNKVAASSTASTSTTGRRARPVPAERRVPDLRHERGRVVDGKQACKAALQRQLGLPERRRASPRLHRRLDEQKDIDLILNSRSFMSQDVQIVFLGSAVEACRIVSCRCRTATTTPFARGSGSATRWRTVSPPLRISSCRLVSSRAA